MTDDRERLYHLLKRLYPIGLAPGPVLPMLGGIPLHACYWTPMQSEVNLIEPFEALMELDTITVTSPELLQYIDVERLVHPGAGMVMIRIESDRLGLSPLEELVDSQRTRVHANL